MKEMITAGILFLIAILAFALSVRSFCGKGFLLNNAYIYADKRERGSMDKKPYYRQTAIVLLFVGLIFLLNGLSLILENDLIFFAVIAILAITVIYAIVSSIVIEKRKRKIS